MDCIYFGAFVPKFGGDVKTIKAPRFVSFISSPAGRLLRVVIGVGLLIYGFNAVSTAGQVIGFLGIFPLFAGAFDVCVIGPLFGGFFSGDKMRQALHEQRGVSYLGAKSASFLKA